MKIREILWAALTASLLASCAVQIGGPVGAPVSSLPAGSPLLLPAAGDTAVYRIINAYNGEMRGELRYRVERIDAGQVVMSAISSSPTEGLPHTEIYTPDGNWLRRPVVNHDIPVEYSFDPPYPAYAFPLAPGKSWSTRVSATNQASGRRNSVRIDGRVLGTERVTTPAGSFDTFKIRRQVYAGDWDGFLAETNITEFDWYAPALGRAVRTERRSTWFDRSRMLDGPGLFTGGYLELRGDWSVYELISYVRGGEK